MSRPNALLPIIVQAALAIALTVFVALYLRAQWALLEQPLLPAHILGLVGAGVLTTVGMGLLPFNSWVMQRWFGQRVGAVAMWRSFFVAQLAKYLPGGFWSIPGRAILYHDTASRRSRAARWSRSR